jgi:hypothetical protein
MIAFAARFFKPSRGLIPALLACLIYFAGRAPFVGQWDSFDYLQRIVTHRLSDLGIGRPFFIGYNIILWESLKGIFGLTPLQVETVVLAGVIVMGALGVLVFHRLARQLLPAPASGMATLSLMLSPLYAIYSGCVMTEIPMLVASIAAALVLWESRGKGKELLAGVVFGIAVGIREQALTLSGAFLWIIWVRRPNVPERIRSVFRFGLAALAITIAPALWLYFEDPIRFSQRIQTWLRAIPTGDVHLWRNLEATLLYLLALAPAAWLGLLVAAVTRRLRPGKENMGPVVPSPISGVVLCLVFPLLPLLRDADVQIHPRYTLVALPAAIILCASIYYRWVRSPRAMMIWVVLQLAVFGLAQAAIQPFRQIQWAKREFTELVRATVPGNALLISGGYSPTMDYYRGVGDRPQWRILWSGWDWKRERAAAEIADAWDRNEPVYLCDGPYAWLFFEAERLDLHFILRESSKEVVAPGLTRVWP